MRFLTAGPTGLLVELDDIDAATALYRWVRSRSVAALDIVPGARTVLFEGVEDLATLREEVGAWEAGDADTGPVRRTAERVEVPTVYDGPDLEDLARMWDMTVREVVATHTGSDMTVAFCGFAPGFAYCVGLQVPRPVPRLDSPRTRVPTGAVGLAGELTGVYPTSSPGGWRLVGRTDLTLWDSGRLEPATLAPGTVVRFVEVTE